MGHYWQEAYVYQRDASFSSLSENCLIDSEGLIPGEVLSTESSCSTNPSITPYLSHKDFICCLFSENSSQVHTAGDPVLACLLRTAAQLYLSHFRCWQIQQITTQPYLCDCSIWWERMFCLFAVSELINLKAKRKDIFLFTKAEAASCTYNRMG